ncbi:hypothetical protein [Pseudoalteromonas sp. TB64]|uniref:hypothetical protein n=1 Tax=Pseudoalteromonas sp. TB64 TaxID=1938600 RepID=UPI0003FB32D9|nr:hypothetical protein [Pseudoalteromonas sp. TB64]
MSKYDQEYYLPFAAMDDSKLFVGMDKKTVMRRGHRKLNLSEGPMFYMNSYKVEDKKEGVKLPIPDIMIVAGQMVIPNEMMKFLRVFDLPGIQVFPAVYIDDDDNWHESLSVIHCYERIDCLDFEKSRIKNNPKTWEEGDDHKVKQPSLCEAALNAIPEENRLILKINKVSLPHLYCHQRVVDFIRKMKYTGVQFIKVADFEEGMQNHEGFDGVTTY